MHQASAEHKVCVFPENYCLVAAHVVCCSNNELHWPIEKTRPIRVILRFFLGIGKSFAQNEGIFACFIANIVIFVSNKRIRD